MVVNAAGAVVISDGGCPRIISGYAREALVPGNLVAASGATGVVSSGASSFAAADILFVTGSGAMFNGVALNTAASGALVSVATRGMFILPTDASVVAGVKVRCDGQQVQNLGSVAANLASLHSIGRAVTAGASGGFLIVDIQG